MPLKDLEARKAYNLAYTKRWRQGLVGRPNGTPKVIKWPSAKDRMRHWSRAGQNKKRDWLNSMKDVPCRDCGERYPYWVMDFDHLPGCGKDKGLSDMTHRSWPALRAEVAKCDVVCANCHRMRTHIRYSTDPEFIRPTSCGSSAEIAGPESTNQVEMPLDVDLEVS